MYPSSRSNRPSQSGASNTNQPAAGGSGSSRFDDGTSTNPTYDATASSSTEPLRRTNQQTAAWSDPNQRPWGAWASSSRTSGPSRPAPSCAPQPLQTASSSRGSERQPGPGPRQPEARGGWVSLRKREPSSTQGTSSRPDFQPRVNPLPIAGQQSLPSRAPVPGRSETTPSSSETTSRQNTKPSLTLGDNRPSRGIYRPPGSPGHQSLARPSNQPHGAGTPPGPKQAAPTSSHDTHASTASDWRKTTSSTPRHGYQFSHSGHEPSRNAVSPAPSASSYTTLSPTGSSTPASSLQTTPLKSGYENPRRFASPASTKSDLLSPPAWGSPSQTRPSSSSESRPGPPSSPSSTSSSKGSSWSKRLFGSSKKTPSSPGRSTSNNPETPSHNVPVNSPRPGAVTRPAPGNVNPTASRPNVSSVQENSHRPGRAGPGPQPTPGSTTPLPSKKSSSTPQPTQSTKPGQPSRGPWSTPGSTKPPISKTSSSAPQPHPSASSHVPPPPAVSASSRPLGSTSWSNVVKGPGPSFSTATRPAPARNSGPATAGAPAIVPQPKTKEKSAWGSKLFGSSSKNPPEPIVTDFPKLGEVAAGTKASMRKSEPSPRRTPTESSYLTFDGQPFDERRPEQTWMYASDAREQVFNAPPANPRGGTYPNFYGNSDGMPLTVPDPVVHTPLKPHTTSPWKQGERVGSWRAFYNDQQREMAQFGYHDKKKQKTGRGKGQGADFSIGHYHPAA